MARKPIPPGDDGSTTLRHEPAPSELPRAEQPAHPQPFGVYRRPKPDTVPDDHTAETPNPLP